MLPWPRAGSDEPASYDQGPLSKSRGKFCLIYGIFSSTPAMSTVFPSITKIITSNLMVAPT